MRRKNKTEFNIESFNHLKIEKPKFEKMNDDFFREQNRKMKENIDKYGLPKEIVEIQKERIAKRKKII